MRGLSGSTTRCSDAIDASQGSSMKRVTCEQPEEAIPSQRSALFRHRPRRQVRNPKLDVTPELNAKALTGCRPNDSRRESKHPAQDRYIRLRTDEQLRCRGEHVAIDCALPQTDEPAFAGTGNRTYFSNWANQPGVRREKQHQGANSHMISPVSPSASVFHSIKIAPKSSRSGSVKIEPNPTPGPRAMRPMDTLEISEAGRAKSASRKR